MTRHDTSGWTCDDRQINDNCRNPFGCHCAEITALRAARDTSKSWVIITDPGCVPDRKGPFLNAAQLKRFLREAMAGRPYSHLMVLTCSDIQPSIEDGTQCLEMLDARSFPTTRKHRERLKSIRLPVPPKTSVAPTHSRIGDHQN